MLIDEKCENLKVAIDRIIRNINPKQKETSNILQAYTDLHSLINAVEEGISSISK